MSSYSILVEAFIQSDAVGKCIFFVLLTLSILTWTILIQKLIAYRKIIRSSQSLFTNISNHSEYLLQLEDINSTIPYGKLYHNFKEKAKELIAKNRFFATDPKRIFLSNHDIELIEDYINVSSHMEFKKLNRHLYILHTIVALAPFVGILGTVWGILVALSEMQQGSALLSNKAIIGGLSTALGTTVLGLIIAIPALIAYNFLKNAHKNYFADMQDFSHYLLSTLQIQYLKANSDE